MTVQPPTQPELKDTRPVQNILQTYTGHLPTTPQSIRYAAQLVEHANSRWKETDPETEDCSTDALTAIKGLLRYLTSSGQHAELRQAIGKAEQDMRDMRRFQQKMNSGGT